MILIENGTNENISGNLFDCFKLQDDLKLDLEEKNENEPLIIIIIYLFIFKGRRRVIRKIAKVRQLIAEVS